MKRRAIPFHAVALSAALALGCAGQPPAPSAGDVKVFLQLGDAAIPVGVDYRFSDVSAALPEPGTLLTESHAEVPDAHTYCYRFGAEGRNIVEIYDSELGMHTAKLAVRDLAQVPAAEVPCPALASTPMFRINGVTLALDDTQVPRLDGFTPARHASGTVLKRRWKYRSRTRPQQASECFERLVAVEFVPAASGFSSITVINWDEPGRC